MKSILVTNIPRPYDIELHQLKWIGIWANQEMFIDRLYNNIQLLTIEYIGHDVMST